MVSQSPTPVWKRIPVLHGALSAAVAAVSPTLIRANLIPDQLSIIGLVGSLFVLVGFLIAWVYRAELRKRLRPCIIISCAALILLVLLQIFFVETVEDYGNPPETHRFLVGYEFNSEGQDSLDAMGQGSLNELIKFAGADRIPTWYGGDYLVVLTIYALSYIVLILGVVFTLGNISTFDRENA
jgi:hypothetical protein